MVGIVAPATYAADPTSTVCTTLGSDSNCSKTDNGIDINHVITATINLFSVIVGVVAVIMIMVSGFRYVTSGGDSSKTAAAKNTLIYALVGLVIVAFAQVIVRFVLERVSAPSCPSGQVLNGGTNKCVAKKKTSNGTITQYYAVEDKRYALNFRLS